ncbi:hypothetical protein LNTAR_18525 [Lentisphaera araneosa HTCC2155]|uniref:DUF4159 domain-containing protein n=1 Tax=Lentisphaera araneosa HTCC2155 TaxID=313628 RepID=A6DNL1_9BACT|nr:DUF4159 domain-containing protein [Lentisphaera araneosa]EDM26670.1 hypothetical protein LNTAR_18525 [Lentisphaera araneosa HTCC2155]
MYKSFLLTLFMTINCLFAVTDEDLVLSIDLLINNIKSQQAPTGHIGGRSAGYTAVNALALSYAGVKASDPVMRKALKVLLDNPPSRIYDLSVYIMLLSEVDKVRYKNEIDRQAQVLIRTQANNGTWNYTGTGPGDNSVTQFALLGLNAARAAGVRIPDVVFERSRDHYIRQQNKDGGWGYVSSRNVTPSMTAAGLSSLSICGEELEDSLEVKKGPRFIGKYLSNPNIQKSYNKLENILKTSPQSIFSNGYTSYGLERVGIFFDRRYIANIDWYRFGATSMIRNQFRFSTYSEPFFSLLFLAKGNTPLLMGKLTPTFAKNNSDLRRNDCRNMMKDLTNLLETKVDWEKVSLSQKNRSLGKLPILYWSGYNVTRLTDDENKVLKKFLDDGGTLLIAPALSSRPFVDGTTQELRKIYPASVFEEVSNDHPLRQMYYDLRTSQLPLKVLKSYCSTHRVFLLEDDFSIQYEAKKVHKINRLTLANMARYAMGEKPLLGRLVERQLLIKKEEKQKAITLDKKDNADGMQLAYLSYTGVESLNKKSMGLELMQAYFRQSMNFPSRNKAQEVDLRDLKAMQQQPFIAFSGSKKLNLSTEEKANLKFYLENGGFIFCENTCSKTDFGDSVAELLLELFPKEQLQAIPEDHVLYKEPYSQALTLLGKAQGQEQFLKGLRLSQRYVLVVSPYDLSSSISGGAQSFGGLDTESAIRLFTNIISYALTY